MKSSAKWGTVSGMGSRRIGARVCKVTGFRIVGIVAGRRYFAPTYLKDECPTENDIHCFTAHLALLK